jgi:hypothetical protein
MRIGAGMTQNGTQHFFTASGDEGELSSSVSERGYDGRNKNEKD